MLAQLYRIVEVQIGGTKVNLEVSYFFKYVPFALSLPSSDPSMSSRPATTDASFDVWSLHIYPSNFICMCSRVTI